jgi:FKBP-type peptidyl-prolyl cis-trans isomerase FkpA
MLALSCRLVLGWGALVVLASALAGCDDSPTSPSGNAPFSQTDLRAGAGTAAANGNTLTVHYTGWLYNASQPEQKGAQVDSSVGGGPFKFVLGAGQVISGWDRGLPGMKVGGLRRLVIPPSLAYGGVRYGPIPPNATLVFEIELIAVQ